MPISDEERKYQREKLAARSVDSYEQRLTEQNREQVEMELAAMAPPTITVPQCHACNSPRRLWIEKALIQGASYTAISEHLSQTGEHIDRRGISKHAQNHMPFQDAVTRAVMEKEADLIGQQYEDGVEGAFTIRGALNVMIRKAYNDVMNNVTTMEPRDMIQAIDKLAKLEEGQGTIAVESAKMQVRIFMEAIQNVTTDTMTEEEGEQFRTALVEEVKRLRSRDEIEVEVENNLKALPDAKL
jgi:hypothetical protein